MIRIVLFGALLSLGCAGFAHATGYEDFNSGIGDQGNGQDDAAIADFTKALAEPDLPQHLKHVAYIDRGISYVRKKSDGAAIADFSAAITLMPANVAGYFYRASAYDDEKQYDRAIADLTTVLGFAPQFVQAYSARADEYEAAGRYGEAIADDLAFLKLRPDDPSAIFALGFAQWANGDLKSAHENFDKSFKLDSTFAYAALWSDIAQSEAGSASPDVDTGDIEFKKWPGQALRLFLGRASPDSIPAAARSDDADVATAQKCEADFYVAEWQLMKKNAAAAAPLFRQVVDSCSSDLLEQRAATVEIKHMTPAPAAAP